MATLMQLSTYITGVNILLILSLLYVYVRNFTKIKTLFTSGLLLFALLFLVQNIVALYYSVTMMPLYAEGVETFVFIYSVLQSVAFIILNYITWS